MFRYYVGSKLQFLPLTICIREVGLIPRDSRLKLITIIKIEEILCMSKDLESRGKFVGI